MTIQQIQETPARRIPNHGPGNVYDARHEALINARNNTNHTVNYDSIRFNLFHDFIIRLKKLHDLSSFLLVYYRHVV